MTNEQLNQIAKLAIMQMSEKDKSDFIKLVEADMFDIAENIARGKAQQGITNQLILASKALDQVEAFSEVIYDELGA